MGAGLPHLVRQRDEYSCRPRLMGVPDRSTAPLLAAPAVPEVGSFGTAVGSPPYNRASSNRSVEKRAKLQGGAIRSALARLSDRKGKGE